MGSLWRAYREHNVQSLKNQQCEWLVISQYIIGLFILFISHTVFVYNCDLEEDLFE